MPQPWLTAELGKLPYQAAAPIGDHKSQDRVWVMPSWARLEHPPVTAGTAGRLCQAGS